MISIEQLDKLLHSVNEEAFIQLLEEYGYYDTSIGIDFILPRMYFINNLELFLEATDYNIECLLHIHVSASQHFISQHAIQRVVQNACLQNYAMTEIFQQVRPFMNRTGFLMFFGEYAQRASIKDFEHFVHDVQLGLHPFFKPKEYSFQTYNFSKDTPINDGWAFYMQHYGYWDAMNLEVYERLPPEGQAKLPEEYAPFVMLAEHLDSSESFGHLKNQYHDANISEIPLMM